jgi:hypothetical protein
LTGDFPGPRLLASQGTEKASQETGNYQAERLQDCPSASLPKEDLLMKIIPRGIQAAGLLAAVSAGLWVGEGTLLAQGGTITHKTDGVANGAADTNTVLILDTTVAGTTGDVTTSVEATQAAAMGFNVEIDDAATWAAKSTALFATYRSIILGDPQCEGSPSPALDPAVANRTTWSPAVTGSVVVVGTDPAFHSFLGGTAGATELTANSIAFASALASPLMTGAYVSLSCYYARVPQGTPSTVPVLDQFGSFTAIGQSPSLDTSGSCPETSHIIAPKHPVVTTPNLLMDSDLSNWGCSTHEEFASSPATFPVIAIQEDVTATGFTAPDGTSGAPYILAKTVQAQTLTFPAGNNETEVATFNSGDSQNSSSWKATLNVNTSFNITVTEHEVECDTGVACNGDDFNGVNNYRCRWEEYFSQDAHLPIGIPYSHGKCVYYRVENPPSDSSIGSDIMFKIGYHDPPGTPSGTPYCSTLPGGLVTRFFRDPSSAPPADAATNHSFAFDITQGSVNETGSVGDPTISGDTTKTLNDYAVACRDTSATAKAVWLKPAPGTTPTFKAGSAINLEVRVTSATGTPIIDAATSPNSMPLLITGPGGVSQTLGTSPGFWAYDSLDNWYVATWKSPTMPAGMYTLCVNSTAFDYSPFQSVCTIVTLK